MYSALAIPQNDFCPLHERNLYLKKRVFSWMAFFVEAEEDRTNGHMVLSSYFSTRGISIILMPREEMCVITCDYMVLRMTNHFRGQLISISERVCVCRNVFRTRKRHRASSAEIHPGGRMACCSTI